MHQNSLTSGRFTRPGEGGHKKCHLEQLHGTLTNACAHDMVRDRTSEASECAERGPLTNRGKERWKASLEEAAAECKDSNNVPKPRLGH